MLNPSAAFGRLRVETPEHLPATPTASLQPPSGGCVLKHDRIFGSSISYCSAAFGRLRVETLANEDCSTSHLVSRLRAAAC